MKIFENNIGLRVKACGKEHVAAWTLLILQAPNPHKSYYNATVRNIWNAFFNRMDIRMGSQRNKTASFWILFFPSTAHQLCKVRSHCGKVPLRLPPALHVQTCAQCTRWSGLPMVTQLIYPLNHQMLGGVPDFQTQISHKKEMPHLKNILSTPTITSTPYTTVIPIPSPWLLVEYLTSAAL